MEMSRLGITQGRLSPMNDFTSPADISSAALFLLSEQAKFITGGLLEVDGGQTHFLPK
tara:strand:- start:1952 stop:2125 length:174 start_codon:yes stop_codon:yes gene_type:complete